ncbi:MAG: MFS transporter [Thermomicrobiales bacterium]|nr:MFS transporter [Thermomicrobiales bacterium]
MSTEPIETHLEKPGAFEALKNAFFARYVGSVSFSLIGMWIRITAMGYLVYDLTEDPFKLGLIGVVQGAPQLVFGPLAGAYLDRLDRRKVLMGVQFTLMACMLFLSWLVWTETVTFGWLVAISVIVGASASFDWPARLSILPLLVSRRELPSAVAIHAAAFNGARVIGPALAGWMIALIGMAGSFLVSGLLNTPYLIMLFGMAALIPTAPAVGEVVEKPFHSLMEGYRYIWRTVEIRTLIGNDLFPIIIGMSYQTMTPAIARDVFNLGAGGLGVLMTATGIGSLAGTLLVTRLNGRRNRGRIVLMGLSSFAVLIVIYGLSSTLWLSILAISMVGFGYAVASTMNDTLIQLKVDDRYRGRVMAAYSTIWGFSPAGGLLAGLMANYVGLQWAVALNGFIVLAYVVFLWFCTPMQRID